jgi:hypothetical protein
VSFTFYVKLTRAVFISGPRAVHPRLIRRIVHRLAIQQALAFDLTDCAAHSRAIVKGRVFQLQRGDSFLAGACAMERVDPDAFFSAGRSARSAAIPA